ncbi:ferric reductase-like transmembrane domain-containing protein [Streptomyces sp. PSRA5]|uniref:ferric reductase-like transmembrane domain-containing protein n=1 Tax=Streptomyces panacea TaxID=3035064 RepID=UPI00339C1694
MTLQSKIRSALPSTRGMSPSVRGGLSVAALVLVPLLAVAGSDGFRAMLDFTTGVLSLVSLTAAVAWGLMATDRLLLSPRHRLLAQGIHRFTAMASLGFLLLHATVKVSLGHVALIGAVLPFGLGITGTNGLIGLGSLAGFLMVIAAATGALRSAFALPGKIAGRWRALHMLAYPAWCFALMHGLYAGRAAATWVMTMYCLALVAVIGAVSVRMLPQPVRRRVADKILKLTGGVRETPEPEQSGLRDSGRRESGRRDLTRDPLPGAVNVPEVEFEQRFPRQRSASAPASAGASAAPLGASRVPPRIAPPSPPLYEAGRPTGADPFADTFVPGSYAPPSAAPYAAAPPTPPAVPYPDPLADTYVDPGTRTGAGAGGGTGRGGPGPSTGTGLSAGYRAVSFGTDPSAPAPAPSPFGGPSDPLTSAEIPYAERIPMTEEIPVISEPSAAGAGMWPTPSPPPPAQARLNEPAAAPPVADPYQQPSPYQQTFQTYEQQETYQQAETNRPSDTYLQSAPYPRPDATPGPDLYQQADLYRQSDDTFQQPPANGGGTPSAGEPWYPPAGDRQ